MQGGRILAMLALLTAATAARAVAPDFVMIAPADQVMPLAKFEGDKLTDGILKQLGDQLAERLGRRVRYVTVPGDKTGQSLQAGKADGVCYVLPFWIDGQFDWSKPFLPDAELVASLPEAAPIRAITDLRDKTVGTVTSYRYPRIAQVLGAHFLRDDAPSMEANLRRVASGKVKYTIIGRLNMDYQLRANKDLKLREDLVFASFNAQCAFARNASVPFADIDRAIDAMVRDGSVQKILARYR